MKENTIKKLEILVVEDSPIHQEAAKEQLATDYNLTVVGSFDEATDFIAGSNGHYGPKCEPRHYDAVLTDLMLPQGEGRCQGDTSKASELQPFGYVIAFIAYKMGIQKIGVVTDASHHSSAMAYAMDFLGVNSKEPTPIQIGEERKVIFRNQDIEIYSNNRKKNWKAVLEALIK